MNTLAATLGMVWNLAQMNPARQIGALSPCCCMVPIGLIGVVGFIFWIWMLIDCIQNESSEGNDKIIWILIIVLTGWIGALIYFFVRKNGRRG